MRETRRAGRGLLGGAALLLALLALVTGGCGSPPGPVAVTTVTGASPLYLPASPWQTLALPAPPGMPLGWAVAPDDPNTLFVCAADPRGPISLWRTSTAGRTWSRVGLPPISTGTGCEIAYAADDPRVMVFAVSNWRTDRQPGEQTPLFLSRDGGATWTGVLTPPDLPASQASGATAQTAFVVSAQALYLWYSYGGGDTGTAQVSALERSEDGGASWTRIDGAFGTGALFFPPRVGPDGSLAVSVYAEGSGAAPSDLWLSTDAGNSWHRSGAIAEHAGQMLLTPPARSDAWPAAATPFYALIAEQIPSALYRERVVQTADGRTWAALPPLPVPGTNAAQYGIFQALAVAPDGRLLVFGVDPRTGVPTAESSPSPSTSTSTALWLWAWNPRVGRWSVLPEPLRFTGRVSGALGWQAQVASDASGATYLYAADWFGSGATPLYRVRLPAPSGAP